jgi:alpha-galactosidase
LAQLAATKVIGCEVFTVDAGWYGIGEGPWHSLVGDWREKQEGAFRGNMSAFADKVRASGLGFGLWVEPERNHADAPVVKAHPDWFLPGLGGFFYPDLSQPEAYHYILVELSRLIETYQLVWMKIDFNFELGTRRDQFHGYFECWYRLLDELREKYPNTFFEGCASGGMRLDLNTLAHLDGHFLSDTVNPIDILRISQSAMLRLPPGRLTKWAVLRAHGDQTLTPSGGDWDNAILADVDFVCRAALHGTFGISGDLAGLPEKTRTRLRRHVDLFKEWREFIRGAAAHLLSPVQSIDDRSGWVAFQLQNPTMPEAALVFVYRLLDGRSQMTFHLRDLDTAKTYTVTEIDTSETSQPISGLNLQAFGLKVALPHPFRAAIFIVQLQD